MENLTYSKLQNDCSREKSRDVRRFLNTTIFREYPSDSLLPTCAISPLNDIYAYQEANKKYVRRFEWKCLFCQKVFKSEYYVDKHMTFRHQDKLNVSIYISVLRSFFLKFQL